MPPRNRTLTFVVPDVVCRRLAAVSAYTNVPRPVLAYAGLLAATRFPPSAPASYPFPLEGPRDVEVRTNENVKEALSKVAMLYFYKRYDFMLEYGMTQVRADFIHIAALLPSALRGNGNDAAALAEMQTALYLRWVEVSPPCHPLAVRPPPSRRP